MIISDPCFWLAISFTWAACNKYLLSNHIDCVLNTAVRDDREDRSVNHPKLLDTVDFEVTVHNTLLYILGDTCSSARVFYQLADIPRCTVKVARLIILTESCLRSFQNHPVHSGIRSTGHGPGIIFPNDIFHAVSIHENIIHKPNSLSECQKIEVAGEEIEIDIGLIECVGRLQFDLTGRRNRSKKIDDDGEPVSRRRGRNMPLKGIREHGLSSSFSN